MLKKLKIITVQIDASRSLPKCSGLFFNLCTISLLSHDAWSSVSFPKSCTLIPRYDASLYYGFILSFTQFSIQCMLF